MLVIVGCRNVGGTVAQAFMRAGGRVMTTYHGWALPMDPASARTRRATDTASISAAPSVFTEGHGTRRGSLVRTAEAADAGHRMVGTRVAVGTDLPVTSGAVVVD